MNDIRIGLEMRTLGENLPIEYFKCKDGSIHVKPKKFKIGVVKGFADKLSFVYTLLFMNELSYLKGNNALAYRNLRAMSKSGAYAYVKLLSYVTQLGLKLDELFRNANIKISTGIFYPAKTNYDIFGSIDATPESIERTTEWLINNLDAFLRTPGFYVELRRANNEDRDLKYLRKQERKKAIAEKKLGAEISLW